MNMERRAAFQEPEPDPEETAHQLIAGDNPCNTYNEAYRRLHDYRRRNPEQTFILRYFEMPGSALGQHHWMLVEVGAVG